MTAVDVILIRGEITDFLSGVERDVFHIEVTGLSRVGATAGCNRVQVIAAVLFGGEDDASVGREVQGSVFAQFGKRIVELVATAPELVSRARRGICDPQGPGLRTYRDQRKLGFFARRPDEHDLLAIRRPAGHGIFVDARRQIADRRSHIKS